MLAQQGQKTSNNPFFLPQREGYVNRENTPQQSREVTYGGSPLRYRRELSAYIAKNDLAGFHLTYLPGRQKL